MALQVHEREDLLRDATALVDRVELEITLENGQVTLFAGFRAQGATSIYFGNDPAYHFTSTGLLRRAYVDGRIIKAEHGQLVAWQRRHVNSRVEMIRHELTEDENQQFLTSLAERLADLYQVLVTEEYQLVGQVPCDAKLIERLQQWLASHQAIEVAQSPHVC